MKLYVLRSRGSVDSIANAMMMIPTEKRSEVIVGLRKKRIQSAITVIVTMMSLVSLHSSMHCIACLNEVLSPLAIWHVGIKYYYKKH